MAFLKKINIYYISTLLFLFINAGANFLSANNIYWFLLTLFMIIVAASKKLIAVKELKPFIFFSLAYVGYVGIRDVFINRLDLDFLNSDILFLFKFIFLSYFYCLLMKEKLVTYLVLVSVNLTVLSLFFYFFQVIGFGDYLYSFSNFLNLPNGSGMVEIGNFLVFSYSKFHTTRNSGFFWEPGAFACFLTVVLLLNLFVNNFKFDGKTKILIIGLITTVSTTGYLALFVIFFLWYRYRNPKINLWILVLIPLLIVLIVNIPFLGDKISKTVNGDMRTNIPKMINKEQHVAQHYENKQVPLNRFSSMIVIYDTFESNLILGVSNKYDAILNKKYNVNISNGVFDFLAKFGLVGLIFLLYKYYKFCRFYLGRVELVIYCIVILLIIGTGETILFFPYILIFLFMPFLQTNLTKRKGYPRNI